MKTILRGKPLVERFWAQVDRRGDFECWLWTGPIDRYGYGTINSGKKHLFAHRLALQIDLGRPLGDGLVAAHRCHVKLCCNPIHLYEGTVADNNRDLVESGRQARGERQASAKLTENSARELKRRYLSGERATELAAEFTVSQSLVYRIGKGLKWSHI